jgi:hypothetical protein
VLIASGIIILALLAGLLCNRFLRRRAGDDDAPSLTDLVSPLETLAVLILAFVLVGAADSYGQAEDAASEEAATVDHLFETAEYAPVQFRKPLQAATVCYARAVHHYSWPAMQDGTDSTVPSIWSTEIRRSFTQLAAGTGSTMDDTVFGILVDTDNERSNARQSRINESTPAIPDIVYWFMALTLAITVAGYAYSVRLRKGCAHVVGVAVITLLFVGSLLLIADVDSPFSGEIRIEPTSMEYTEQDIDEDFAAAYGPDQLPCDGSGNRLQS